MSRIAKNPIPLPKGVEVKIDGQTVAVKGPKGSSSHNVHEAVAIMQEGNALLLSAKDPSKGTMYAGTSRALLFNIVKGVSEGFQRKLEINGVGYRAQVQGNVLNLTLGYSHPINFPIPTGITIETPSPTEIMVKGSDKQLVGQVAKNIRAKRPPEPYKGKGVKFADETIVRKEAKKT